MLSRYRQLYEQTSIVFGKVSLRLGLSPDFWTIFSLLSSGLAAVLFARGNFITGLGMMIVVNLADMMDGATARAGGTGTPFGTVFDHTIDRYAEFIMLGGLMAGGWISPILGMFTASGIIMASYVRAKAESVAKLEHCIVGLAGRQEKLILLMLALIFFAINSLTVARVFVFLAGAISHVTAVQRLLYTRRQVLGPRKAEQPNHALPS